MSRRFRRPLVGLPLALALLVLTGGCGTARPLDDQSRCVSWREEIAPLLAPNCSACHSSTQAMGGFDATSYLSTVGTPGQPSFATAGDASSPLLATLNSPDAVHSAVAASLLSSGALSTLQSWVVDCRLNFARGTLHPPGILNPADTQQFHGALLRDAGWQFGACIVCHGTDATGGAAKVSCLSCHPAGPTSCDTCHGAQLALGHQAHLRGTTQGKQFACSECHPTPTDYRDPGHLFLADGTLRTEPVRLLFSALAATVPPLGAAAGPPTFLPDSRSCQNVYCHGANFIDSSATNTQPQWLADPKQAACGTCHGTPPQSHQPDRLQPCFFCHNRTVDSAGNLLRGGLHLNGQVDIGDGSGSCSACHGSAGNAGPPRDVSGNSAISALGVGVHQSHLLASHRLRGPMVCGDCHVVPDKLDSPGHIGSTLAAAVFPQSPLFSSIASSDSATPQWDHASGRCSNVYCHGGGSKLGLDLTPTLQRTPSWTVPGQASCGSCHGIPPRDANHLPTMRLIDCAGCHSKTIDATGALIFTGTAAQPISTHINGVVDVP